MMKKLSTTIALSLFISITAVSQQSLANKANDTLIYASNSWPENVSPYHNSAREGVILGHLAWDTLIYRDPTTGKLEPQLATDWKWEDSTHLLVHLRKGVKFQNGDPFSADDVAFTFNWGNSSDSKVVTLQNINWIKHVKKIDDYTVEFELKAPFPAALQYLAGPLPIYPKKYFESVGLKGFSEKPIGTGPYKITKIINSQEVDMEANQNYWQGSPLGKPKIKHLVFKTIPDKDTQLAQLMTGQVDWLWRVPSDQARQLSAVPNVTVMSKETMRVGYITMNSQPIEGQKNPFENQKVRQAVNYAINREGMVKNLIQGDSSAIYTPCYSQQFGCETSAATKYPYNPEKAKQLLAEAGYPNGFATEIYAYRDRDYIEAIIGDLRNVGIKANLRFVTYSTARDAIRSGTAPMAFMTWGSYGINDASAIISVYFKGGADDEAKNPEVIKELTVADTSVDPAVREANYSKAIKIITTQAYWAPLFTYSYNYAFDKDLNFTPYSDSIPRFFKSSWK